MIVTIIAVNSDTREQAIEALEALAKSLRKQGLADIKQLAQKNTFVTDRAVVLYSLKEES